MGPPPETLGRLHMPQVRDNQIGRLAVVFDEDDLVRLLRAAVEREGGQTAFAKRYKVDRTRVNRILSRQLRASEAIAKALGLRRAYIAD